MELFSKLVVTEEKSLKMITKKFELSFFDFNRSEEHTSELQSQSNLVCRLLLEKKKKKFTRNTKNNSYTIQTIYRPIISKYNTTVNPHTHPRRPRHQYSKRPSWQELMHSIVIRL